MAITVTNKIDNTTQIVNSALGEKNLSEQTLVDVVNSTKATSQPKVSVKNIMTVNPISIEKNALAAKALSLMNNKRITSLCVHDKKNKNKTIGVLHVHTILQSNIS